ncbi:MAG: calcium-binding protein, partial [Gammaproteobacteria bacterium]|nr:calcium-binding protein [Gammaproteobacteria bacterium]
GAGGGAGFTADPSGLLGDDIGHGPYAGGIVLADQVEFTQVPGALDPGSDDLPFEAIDDHVIHNIQAGPGDFDNYIDIPDVALRHNDIYPRGDWDLTSVSLENPWPHNPSQANFEDQMVSNAGPDNGALESTDFSGSNTTARFTGTTTIFDRFGIDTGIVGIQNNNGDFYFELDQPGETIQGAQSEYVGQAERVNWDLGKFILQTQAPGGSQADWDGTRIFLYEGETITMTPYSWRPSGNGDYTLPPIVGATPGAGLRPTSEVSDWGVNPNFYMAIDHDGTALDGSGSDPLFSSYPEMFRFGWTEVGEAQSGPLTYEVTNTGWHYLGIGNIPGDVTSEGMYRTLVEIDGVPYGEHDYTATDYVLSDDAHVTVEAREEGALDNDTVNGRGLVDEIHGTEGENIIISSDYNDDLFGYGGDDVLIGRGGDDHLYGGAGRDLFLFENAATDGSDTIYDFSAAEGDIINLDALFDVLDISETGVRELVAETSVSDADDTILTAKLNSADIFSITLADTDVTDVNVAGLIAGGNLVVDES